MASSKEMQQSSRPLTQHRPSLSGASPSGLPGRQSHSRNNSHSLLTGSLNPSHRVTRRKSVTTPNANLAALTAALRESEHSAALPIAQGTRRMSKGLSGRGGIPGSLPSPPASLPNHKMIPEGKHEQDSAIDDDTNDGSSDEANKDQKARFRRASDGQPLGKDGKKSNRVEVRCEQCGKGYKHSSCLTKHLWEHTPEWAYTSKLLISKHQQVQLLEAASVLVAMNGKESSATPPESTKDFPSDPESVSPAASGYSDQADRQSSADTTPPPQIEGFAFNGTSYRNKRLSSGSGFAPSYQSATSFGASSVTHGSGFGHFRQPSTDVRPTSSGRNATNQDDRDLAAAVELLSCSFGSSNGSRPMAMLSDAPPVPPLPAQYLDQATSLTNTDFINSFPRRQPESFTRGERRRPSEDVKMEESGDSVMEDDDDFDRRSRARSDEDDDGVFGRMEE